MSLFIFFKDLFFRNRLNDPTSKTVFDHYFFGLKYYLRKEASSKDFAPILNIEIDVLDKIATSYYGQSFNVLVNQERYKHFIQELEYPFNESLSIETIIKLSGFDNNESFAQYIKEKV